ncbi:zinc-ribbon domain-containing protein [Arthrobacter sp. ISL-72]|nr:zinc-ribbon domain-containing protein [Arthrobacter sp. ISL-72]
MLLLFGIKTVQRALPGRLSTCRYCGVYAEQYLEERASKFTLFFIPVFTMSRTYFVTCSNCGQRSSLSKRGMRALAR